MLLFTACLYALTGLFWLGYYLPLARRHGWYRRELAAVCAAGGGGAALCVLTLAEGRMTPLLVTVFALFSVGLMIFLLVEGKILRTAAAAVRTLRRGEIKAPPVVLVPGYRLENGQPGPVLQCRLERAKALLEENPGTRAVLSGGASPGETRSEAAAMAVWLQEAGIAWERLLREEGSASTAENMRFCRTLTSGGPVGLVTSGFHLYRAMGEAKKAGFSELKLFPAENGPRWQLPYHMAREFLTILSDKAKGYL